MPLLFLGVVAWALGTAFGLTGSGVPGLLLAVALAAGVALWRAARGRNPLGAWEGHAALALLFGAALLLGDELRRADLRCADAARQATSWEVRLRASAAPGSFVPGEIRGPGCVVRVALAVRSGSAEAGAVVRVTRAEPSDGMRGLLLREAAVRRIRPAGPLDRWRAQVGRTLDARFGEDAAIVRALLIADTRGLTPEIRERYADAGLVHVLSISGLHVGIVGGALLLVFEALRWPMAAGRVAAVVLIIIYVLAIGAPPAAARSATLFAAVSLTRLWQRPVSPWGTFALGALVPLLEPRTVLHLGWQLSVSGYAGVLVSGRWARRVVPERWRGWRASLARDVTVGVLTTLTTAPLIAWHFGRLSLVSPVSNLAAGPVVAVLQPALFVAMLTPLEGVARFVADAARPLLRTLDATASAAASLPGAAVVVAPTASVAIITGIATVAILAAAWRRHWATPAALALACIALVAWAPSAAPRTSGEMELHLLDVGQGDAIAIRSPRGRWVLVDAGRSWTSGDAGRATVVPYLRRLGGPLAVLILTHPHADHIGGAASVTRALRPAAVYDAAFVAGSETYRGLLREVARVGARWQRVRPGETLDVDGVAVEFLAPDSAWTVSLSDPNAASTVVRVRYGNVRMLLTGDAEAAEEAWLLDRDPASVRAEVLKVGHHGSRTSSTPDFVDAVAPRLALVSVGTGNMYGHPAPEVMERLTTAGATVLRTDQLGAIVVRTDGARIAVEAAGHGWEVRQPLPSPW
jgi:competence protein ComEC